MNRLRRVISSGTVLLMILAIFATVVSAAPPTVTRSLSSESVAAGGTVDVTITFTTTENLLSMPILFDVVPAGWNVYKGEMTSQPTATPAFDEDHTVGFYWASLPSGTSVTVSYKLHVPTNAGGVYSLYGDLTNAGDHYANVTGQSNIVVGPTDNNTPIVTNPTATPNEILLSESNNADTAHSIATLSVNVNSTAGIRSVVIDLSSIGGSSAQPMTNTAGNVWSVNTGANSLGMKSLAINATGNNGFSNAGVSISLNVLRNGDVNGDGNVNFLGDALYLVRNTRGVPGYTSVNPLVADVDGRGTVDFIGDALYLVRHTRGLPGYETLK